MTKIIAAILALLMLCSCSAEPVPEIPQSEEAVPESAEEIPEETFGSENFAEHITALNEMFGETFFTGFDWSGTVYRRLFIDEQTGRTPYDAVPDKIAVAGLEPDGYYRDTGDCKLFRIGNFSTKDEIREYFSEWFSEEMLSGAFSEAIDENMIEFEEKLYLVRGERSYGTGSCGEFEIISETENELIAEGIFYYQLDNSGTIRLVFLKEDGKLLLRSYEINSPAYEEFRDSAERYTVYEYMTFAEITETGVYPLWMQPFSVIIYDENGVPSIAEGGELSEDDIEGREDIAAVGFLEVDKESEILPDTKAEYDLHGFLQNIYYLWPGETEYRLEPFHG